MSPFPRPVVARRALLLAHRLTEGPGRRLGEAAGHLVFERGGEGTGGVMTHDDARFYRYEASGWMFLRRVLRPGRIRPGDVFIDLGSGKGRVVALAARMPFARVLGVEILDELTRVARRNTEADGRRRCGAVELITADVTSYRIPDDVTHVYMANPFSADVLRSVLDNIAASTRRSPRRIELYYAHPTHDATVREHGLFRHVRTSCGPRRRVRSRWIAVYEHCPEPLRPPS
jgi:hypothetical protein